MTQPLDGKVVLITGSGGGMGRSHAVLMAERGARVAVHDIDPAGVAGTAALVRAAGAPPAEICVDIRDVAALESAIARVERDYGPIDVLVNNAGIGGQGLALADIDADTFDAMFEVNVRGAFFATRAVVPGMKARRAGKIVNISSNFAMGGCPFASHYAAAKSAVSGLTKSWARELAPFGIAVNAVAPGLLETGLTIGSIGRERIAAMAAEVPMGRIAEPVEISYAVAWLASSETDFMTGQVISPNGGVSIVGY